MFTNFNDACTYIQENNIRMVDLKYGDLLGRWHHVTISAQEFTPHLMSSGVGFDGSSIGFKNVKSGDMALIPDLSTGFLDPFWCTPTLSFICGSVEADTKQPFRGDPRRIASNAEKYMQSLGFADESRWGPEFEFYIFNKVQFENSVNVAHYSFDAVEASWNSAHGDLCSQIALHGGYHAIPPGDQLFDLRSKMALYMEDIGIKVKYHHHEVGGSGQNEIETPMMKLLSAADSSMAIKYVTRMTAFKYGQNVTFLPKPLYGEAGNGMHFHIQLFQKNKNVFYDPSSPTLLSSTALYFIGGLLTHAPAVLAFTNPSTNSFRRLVPGFEAPINSFFSKGNRSAAIRIPSYATEPDQVRFEFRPPDATCNPYLAISAMLMAGLDGIKNKIDPTEAGFGPIDEDVFSWSPEQRSKIKALPTSLEGVLDALQKDYDFLLVDDVFERSFIQEWIKVKSKDVEAIRLRPHPYEVQTYFDL
jgi:glutamine synthetase